MLQQIGLYCVISPCHDLSYPASNLTPGSNSPSTMPIRESNIEDVPELMRIRFAVTENVLSDPSLVTAADCVEYLTVRGKGWVYEADGVITGFAIMDMMEKNVWALFIDPGFERQGIGKALHDTMMHWYFSQTEEPAWLGTSPATKAQNFYLSQGWKIAGLRENGEIKFELKFEDWKR